jgi:hypothetical protein
MIMKWWQLQEQFVHQLLLEMGFLLHSLSLLEALVDACPKEGFFILVFGFSFCPFFI